MKVVKEFDPLLRLMAAGGYTVGDPAGRGGHPRVIDRDGNYVVDDAGAITFPISPGDVRLRTTMTRRLVRAGVIPYDPWKPQRKAEREETMETVDKKRKVSRRQPVKPVETEELRRRLRPLFLRVGPINGAMLQEIGTLVFGYARSRGLKAAVGWDDMSQARSATRKLFETRGSLKQDDLEVFERIAVELEEAEKAGVPLLRRYSELLTEALKAPKPLTSEEILTPVRVEAASLEGYPAFEASEGPLPFRVEPERPGEDLALLALYEMARGQDGSEESRARVFGLFDRIRRVERGA